MNGFEKDHQNLKEEFNRALETVYPEELRSYVGRELSAANETPALLCLLAARETDTEPNIGEAAGLQFVHAGLRATGNVLGTDGWEGAGFEPVEEDMVLLAADVLVTVGFDHLLDEYEAATRLVNRFGANKARGMEADDPEESFNYESEQLVETYTTAVEIGSIGKPSEDLVSLAESLAFADCTSDSALDNEGGEHERRAAHLAENFEGHGAHVDAIRTESCLDSTSRAKGVEAQD